MSNPVVLFIHRINKVAQDDTCGGTVPETFAKQSDHITSRFALRRLAATFYISRVGM